MLSNVFVDSPANDIHKITLKGDLQVAADLFKKLKPNAPLEGYLQGS